MNQRTKIYQFLYWYSLIFTILILIVGIGFNLWKENLIASFFFSIVVIYFIFDKFKKNLLLKIFHGLINLFSYCLITIVWIINLITGKTPVQIALGIAITPLFFYFGFELIKKFEALTSKISRPKKKKPPVNQIQTMVPQKVSSINISDNDRRQFLKMIGSTSLGIITLSLLNPKKAGATFFGSVPGPGTVAIKDIDGNKIDPAAKQPTDGYKISKLDDTSSDTYAYYGFVDQNGQWYIQRETISGATTGDFLYTKGTSDFTTSWNLRDDITMTYDLFDSVF